MGKKAVYVYNISIKTKENKIKKPLTLESLAGILQSLTNLGTVGCLLLHPTIR